MIGSERVQSENHNLVTNGTTLGVNGFYIRTSYGSKGKELEPHSVIQGYELEPHSVPQCTTPEVKLLRIRTTLSHNKANNTHTKK